MSSITSRKAFEHLNPCFGEFNCYSSLAGMMSLGEPESKPV